MQRLLHLQLSDAALLTTSPMLLPLMINASQAHPAACGIAIARETHIGSCCDFEPQLGPPCVSILRKS